LCGFSYFNNELFQKRELIECGEYFLVGVFLVHVMPLAGDFFVMVFRIHRFNLLSFCRGYQSMP